MERDAFEREPYVLISAIEHYSYCPRQFALIHIESIFDENLLTMRGGRAHERVHQEMTRMERGRKVIRGLPLWSERHKITGKADAVEIEVQNGSWRVTPVEYKVGKRTRHKHAAYQACAQALCLEEMLDVEVREGAVYYIGSKDREPFDIDHELRKKTIEIVEHARAILMSLHMPSPVADRRCPKCSLLDACMPFAIAAAAKRHDPFNLRAEVELP